MKDIQFFYNGIYYSYLKRKEQFINSGNHLAHFTKACYALDILTKKEMWLNNVTYMNDYQEMKTGMGLVGTVVSTDPWHNDLKNAINSIHPKLFEELIFTLNTIQNRYFYTYGLCLCEFDKYDLTGNEYMWNNYARENGVAIIFNNSILKEREDKQVIPVEILPMYYYNTQDVSLEIEEITRFITENIYDIRQLDYEVVKKSILDKFSFAVWSLKNPQYIQEKEWRIMTNDKIMVMRLDSSSCIRRDMDIKNNEPRYVYKFNYERAGYRLNDILERIIIGTCNNPEKVRDLFVEELAGSVEDIQNKVVISNFRCKII